MNNLAMQQSNNSNFKAIFDGLFAYCVMTDYWSDWALASNYQPPELSLNTIYRNPK